MIKISSLPIGPRLGLAFLAIILLMMALSWAALRSLAIQQDDIDEIVNDHAVKTELLTIMSESIDKVVINTHNMVLLMDLGGQKNAAMKIAEAREVYDQAFSQLQKMPASEDAQMMSAKLEQLRSAARPLSNKVVVLTQEGQHAQAQAFLLAEAAPVIQRWRDALHEDMKLQKEQNQIAKQESEAAYQNARTTVIVGNLLGLALVFGLALVITRSITSPLAQAQAAVSQLASGDLTVQLHSEGKDEIAQLMITLVEMKDSLVRSVTHVRENADKVASVSVQLAQGNASLSERSEEQASALEQTAASMEELGGSARLNAENVRQANRLAFAASQTASQGGLVMGEVVGTMKDINESSKKIADIINVIDGIAFQTNILALNAAVEAARAGEQGRGFAVVASEVRSLAHRSAEAAKEINRLITASVERVEQGSTLVDQAGHTMVDVVQSIKKVTDLIQEIASASTEQSTNVDQISAATTQMDKMTQENVALVEESVAATENLKEQAQDLVHAVAVFKLA